MLHRLAGVVADGGGVLPGSAASLESLPGIGPYTAAAVASIAFGEAVPVLDGNVRRVLSRLHLVESDRPGRSGSDARLWEIAGRLVRAIQALEAEIRLLGPAPAPIARLHGKFRFHLLLQSCDRDSLRAAVYRATERWKQPEDVQWVADMDPMDVL